MFLKSGRVLVVKKPLEREIDEFEKKLVKAYGRSKADKMKLRLLSSEVLRHLKPVLSYRDISLITGLPESVLCRYVKGSIIPSFEQAVKILARISLSIDLGVIL
ncbi:MAG: phosphoribosyltransferase, partial [Desulfurococcaceae archaeon]